MQPHTLFFGVGSAYRTLYGSSRESTKREGLGSTLGSHDGWGHVLHIQGIWRSQPEPSGRSPRLRTCCRHETGGRNAAGTKALLAHRTSIWCHQLSDLPSPREPTDSESEVPFRISGSGGLNLLNTDPRTKTTQLPSRRSKTSKSKGPPSGKRLSRLILGSWGRSRSLGNCHKLRPVGRR